MLYEGNLLSTIIQKIDEQDLSDNYYLRLFLVNDLDTNLISIFVPEIWNYEFSEFVSEDSTGKKITYPCKVLLSAYQEAPKITFTKEWSRFQAFVKIGIQCETVNGVFKEVLEIDTSADMEFNLKLSEDMILRMEI